VHAEQRKAGPGMTRLARYRKDGVAPQMPPPGAAGYLADILWEIGPTLALGMGEGPVTQSEIRAWQHNMDVQLQPWEVQLLRRLSQEYLAQAHQATDPGCKPPYGQLYRAPNLDSAIDDALD
jgi:hypothetical protein